MEATELMIGDWVNICGEPKQVKNLDIRRVGIVFSKLIHAVDETQVFPVPLTAEILEKNGFVPDKFSPYYLPIEDGSVRFSNHQYGLYCNILRPYQRYDGVCDYVHNLQHALRLCGIDKEIVL